MRILVAIPVFNEQQYVTRVLNEVRAYASDILVIDDASTDQTPNLLARQPVDVIRHAVNRGYGRSIRDAFRWADCYSFDGIITMDCDEQHEPASLTRFQEALQSGDADVISGSRYLGTDCWGEPPPEDRRAINAEMTSLINDRLGLSITDAFCGFKGYRITALRKLKLDVNGYALPLQFWVQTAANGLKIQEVPIRLIYNDPNRSFGGPLDDPEQRRSHYLHVFEQELAKFGDQIPQPECGGAPLANAEAPSRKKKRQGQVTQNRTLKNELAQGPFDRGFNA